MSFSEGPSLCSLVPSFESTFLVSTDASVAPNESADPALPADPNVKSLLPVLVEPNENPLLLFDFDSLVLGASLLLVVPIEPNAKAGLVVDDDTAAEDNVNADLFPGEEDDIDRDARFEIGGNGVVGIGFSLGFGVFFQRSLRARKNARDSFVGVSD